MRQAVGVVVGELLESVGRGVVDADDVALVVGDVGVEYIVAGRNKALGQKRPLERVGHELELPHIVAPGQQRAGGIIDRFGELRSRCRIEIVDAAAVGKLHALRQIENVVGHVADAAAHVARLVAVGVIAEVGSRP